MGRRNSPSAFCAIGQTAVRNVLVNSEPASRAIVITHWGAQSSAVAKVLPDVVNGELSCG